MNIMKCYTSLEVTVSEKIGFEKKHRIRYRKFLVLKKYRFRFRKILVSKKVSDSVSENFGIGKKFWFRFRSYFWFRHSLSGEKSIKCNQCDYAFSHAGNLRTHLKTHSGEKSIKCNQCDYASAHPSNLSKHLKRHSGEKTLKI